MTTTDLNKGKRPHRKQQRQAYAESPYMEKVIKINRVTKVCKGGKRLAFRAMAIVGDQKGKVSISLGKSKEVPTAIKKAIDQGKKNLSTINIIEGTIPHEVIGKFGSAIVVIRPAPPGTGVIAGGSIRILLEALGLRNVVAKSIGASNPINTAKAALEGLKTLKNIDEESDLRGKKLQVRFNVGQGTELVSRKTLLDLEDTKKAEIEKLAKKRKPKEDKKAKPEEENKDEGATEVPTSETPTEEKAAPEEQVVEESETKDEASEDKKEAKPEATEE